MQRLVSQSEIVIKGRIVSTQGPIIGERTALIKVDAVFKGTWKDQPLHFSVPSMPLQLINVLQPDEYAVFFLKKVDGKVIPADPFHIMLPIREGRISAIKPVDTLSEVREEMLFTAKGPSEISEEDKYKQNIREEGARKFNRPDIIDALRPLPMNVVAVKYLAEPKYNEHSEVVPNNDDVTKALRNLLPTPDVLLRGALFATLLTRGQFDMLQPAIKYINDQERNSTPENRAQVKAIVNDIAGAISHVTDKKYVPVLGALLEHENWWVRDSAIIALRHIGQSTFPYRNQSPAAQKNAPEVEQLRARLVPLLMSALDDEREGIRRQALWSLSEVARKPWGPYVLDELEKNAKPEGEQKLIAQWKEWWQSEGRKEFEAVK